MSETMLRVTNLTKTFGDVIAVNDISFEVKKGEFFIIIGPSGSGKTTLLKCLVGLQTPDSGYIFLADKDATRTPTHKRDISLIFQERALFPHMTVYDNMAYGLKARGQESAKIKEEVDQIMKLTGLEGLGDRYPREISGGQQQRVALARSLVVKPSILLFDEPLGSLDYELQQRMMVELKMLHQKLGLTFIYVTHNQEQAMTLGDRIMIMNSGFIEQIAPPDELYSTPDTVFVASFVGDINMLRGVVDSVSRNVVVKTDTGSFKASLRGKTQDDLLGKKVAYAIRPEKMHIGQSANNASNRIGAKLIEQIYKGQGIEYLTDLSNGRRFKISLQGQPPSDVPTQHGSEVILGWNTEDALILEKPSVVKGIDIDKAILGA